jgi:hypothetical protein
LGAQPETEHSLFWRLNSLFFEIFSLLISVGNYSNNHCGTAVSAFEIVGLGRKSAIFPVKFPVCREFAWRLARTALRRQPDILSTQDISHQHRDTSCNVEVRVKPERQM